MRAVNLIPSEQRPGAGGTYGRSGGVAYALVGLAAGLVAMSVLWLMARHDIATSNAKVAQLGQQAQQAQAAASGLTLLQQLRHDEHLARERRGAARPGPLRLGPRLSRARTGPALRRLADGGDGHGLDRHDGHSGGGAAAGAATGATGATGAAGAAGATGAAGAAGAAGGAATSATPAGSVPSLSLSGCTTSQSEVAYTLQRLALIDGVDQCESGVLDRGRRAERRKLVGARAARTASRSSSPSRRCRPSRPRPRRAQPRRPSAAAPASSTAVASTSAPSGSAAPAGAASSPSTTAATTASASGAAAKRPKSSTGVQ